MNLNRILHNGIVLDRIPVPLDRLHLDLVKPRDIRWFKDAQGDMVDFRMKTNDRIYWIRWKGPWDIEVKMHLRKLMLRWHYDSVGRLETKDWVRLPFPVDYFAPVRVDAAL